MMDNPPARRPPLVNDAAMRPWTLGWMGLVGRWAWCSLILVIAAVARVFRLDLLGPFIDEAGHVYLANHLDNYPLYLRAAEGGKVLGFWLYYPIAEWVTNPIHGARLFTALLGVATTMGVMWTVWQITGRRAASIVAGLIWAVLPFVVFYDRLALHDPLISFFVAWALGLFVIALRDLSPGRSLVAGAFFGFALITKFTAGLFATLFVLLAIKELIWGQGRQSLRTSLAFVIGAALPVALVIGLIASEWRRTAGELLWYQRIFLTPLGSASVRWTQIGLNTRDLAQWFADYNTLFFGLVSLVLIAAAILWRRGIALVLVIALGAMVIAEIVLLKTWFPRYLVPCLIPLVILVGVGADELGSRLLTLLRDRRLSLRLAAVGSILSLCAAVALVLPRWIGTDYAFLTQPTQASLPPIDQESYLYGWPSGFGVVETATFLRGAIAPQEKVLIVEGGWGRHGHWSIPILMGEPGNVQFQSANFSSAASIAQAAADRDGRRTLLLAEPPIVPLPPPNLALPLRLIFEINRPSGEPGFSVYEVLDVTVAVEH